MTGIISVKLPAVSWINSFYFGVSGSNQTYFSERGMSHKILGLRGMLPVTEITSIFTEGEYHKYLAYDQSNGGVKKVDKIESSASIYIRVMKREEDYMDGIDREIYKRIKNRSKETSKVFYI